MQVRGLLFIFLLGWFCPVAGAEGVADDVELLLIDDVREFPDATEPGAVRYACAPNVNRLAAHFAERDLPFIKDLVRKYKGRKNCHIYYEPTVPGFRALTDDRPIAGFVSGIHPNDFVADRKPSGDSMSVIQFVLSRISKPLDVNLTIVEDYGDAEWPAALERHFPNSPHNIKLIHSTAEDTHQWGQDFIKAGQANGELRLLTTRRLYEGRAEDGNRFLPLLDAFSDDHFVRSKLSWEGGDLQFARDPRDPSKTILFYGSTVRDYWGKELRPREFGWVLQVEFGADSVVDLSHIGPHTDYLVAFPPEGGLALVSEPVRNDYLLARSIVAELQQMYGDRAPKELTGMLGILTRLETGGGEQAMGEILRQIEVLRQILPSIAPYVDPKTDAELVSYIEANCVNNVYECFDRRGRRKLMEFDRDLLRRTVDVKIDQEEEERAHWQLLNLLEAQLPLLGSDIDDQLERAAQTLKTRGFRVVRVPYLYADRQTRGWPGVSYVNLLAVDKMLFTPAFGLGKAEEAYFASMRKKLPGYEVIPVPARMSVVSNGGIHCVFGIIREP